eukprot:TRINITY_DN974_c0_g1_i2.p1 TRINITY_DN974_c0_g1~~TRINITY_DN974_c0_g1_i2.p1  ORF type:complete len:813 (-),score=207.29 TRINITY_DN974_c0_g1_i2:44-2482(-)
MSATSRGMSGSTDGNPMQGGSLVGVSHGQLRAPSQPQGMMQMQTQMQPRNPHLPPTIHQSQMTGSHQLPTQMSANPMNRQPQPGGTQPQSLSHPYVNNPQAHNTHVHLHQQQTPQQHMHLMSHQPPLRLSNESLPTSQMPSQMSMSQHPQHSQLTQHPQHPQHPSHPQHSTSHQHPAHPHAHPHPHHHHHHPHSMPHSQHPVPNQPNPAGHPQHLTKTQPSLSQPQAPHLTAQMHHHPHSRHPQQPPIVVQRTSGEWMPSAQPSHGVVNNNMQPSTQPQPQPQPQQAPQGNPMQVYQSTGNYTNVSSANGRTFVHNPAAGQAPSPMARMIPKSGNLPIPTTDIIQKMLDDNQVMILAIIENQNLGKDRECAMYQAKLQYQLVYLATLAESIVKNNKPIAEAVETANQAAVQATLQREAKMKARAEARFAQNGQPQTSNQPSHPMMMTPTVRQVPMQVRPNSSQPMPVSSQSNQPVVFSHSTAMDFTPQNSTNTSFVYSEYPNQASFSTTQQSGQQHQFVISNTTTPSSPSQQTQPTTTTTTTTTTTKKKSTKRARENAAEKEKPSKSGKKKRRKDKENKEKEKEKEKKEKEKKEKEKKEKEKDRKEKEKVRKETEKQQKQQEKQNRIQEKQREKEEKEKAREVRYWNAEEQAKFIEAINKFGTKDIKAIATYVGTRNANQIRTHLQKHLKTNKPPTSEALGTPPTSAPSTALTSTTAAATSVVSASPHLPPSTITPLSMYNTTIPPPPALPESMSDLSIDIHGGGMNNISLAFETTNELSSVLASSDDQNGYSPSAYTSPTQFFTDAEPTIL